MAVHQAHRIRLHAHTYCSNDHIYRVVACTIAMTTELLAYLAVRVKEHIKCLCTAVNRLCDYTVWTHGLYYVPILTSCCVTAAFL
jgi:hypothetical protein